MSEHSNLCLTLKINIVDKKKATTVVYYKMQSLQDGRYIIREIPINHKKHGTMEPLAEYKNRITDREYPNLASFLIWIQNKLTSCLEHSQKKDNSDKISISLSDSPKRILDLIIQSKKIFSSTAEIVECIKLFYDTGTLKNLGRVIKNTPKGTHCFN